MPPSQLKQLKASLRDKGFVGPQKSKKQRKDASKDSKDRIQKTAALQNIRDKFNPFEVKTPVRRDKFEVVSNKQKKVGPGRPAVTKSIGEERRKATLLREIQSRKKVGGFLDRRFGENDPSMTPEQRAAERFARQSQRKAQKNEIFNLEDEEEGGVELTHGGRALFEDTPAADDFREDISESSEAANAEELHEIDDRPRKRLRMLDEEAGIEEELEEALPVSDRRKTKKEVMEEVIAKSKLHRYERQQAREDDDQLRAELDKGMKDLYSAIRRQGAIPRPLPTPPSDSEPQMNPERAAMLAGKDRQEVEKEYERRVNEMKMDKRSKPTSRTKTEEERAVEEVERLQELEARRMRRMQGEAESSDEDVDVDDAQASGDEEYQDDAEAFGLGQTPVAPPKPVLDVEDEDEFVLDDELIASDPDADMASEEDDADTDESVQNDGDDDFINGLVLPESKDDDGRSNTTGRKTKNGLAYTYPCPQTHRELLKITASASVEDLPTIVQRIRALYHVGLSPENREKLERFSAVLIEHVAYLANEERTPVDVLENILRHLHSMAKNHPEAVTLGFRDQLRQISDQRPLSLTNGDLVVLTGVSTIFPTSDQFHPVVTPAMLTIGRFLGQSVAQTLQDLSSGLFCCTLALTYQKLSKRYVPEVITYLSNVLAVLGPANIMQQLQHNTSWSICIRLPLNSFALKGISTAEPRPISIRDLLNKKKDEDYACNLLYTTVKSLEHAAKLWKDKTAFNEIFGAPVLALKLYLSSKCRPLLHPKLHDLIKSVRKTILDIQISSVSARKPLLLHDHRPLAIKSSIPKFEEGFNPDRHYDPDRDRAQLNKLKAEHKRERKGAMRELRKDANFVAREQLRGKKEKDEAYERKFKKLVAEIQGEEGAEGNRYEREKMKRQGK